METLRTFTKAKLETGFPTKEYGLYSPETLTVEMMKDECRKPRNRKMTTYRLLCANLKENQFCTCSGRIVQKIKKKNSTSAHGKIRVTEEPVWV